MLVPFLHFTLILPSGAFGLISWLFQFSSLGVKNVYIFFRSISPKNFSKLFRCLQPVIIIIDKLKHSNNLPCYNQVQRMKRAGLRLLNDLTIILLRLSLSFLCCWYFSCCYFSVQLLFAFVFP